MDSYASSRPQRAAAVKASGKITSQYSNPFITESKPPPSPPSRPSSVRPPPPKRPHRAQRSRKSQPRDIDHDDEPVPELAYDDNVLVALSPSQLNAARLAVRVVHSQATLEVSLPPLTTINAVAPLNALPPRLRKNIPRADADDDEFVPELADDDHELIALLPSQTKTRTPLRLGKPTTLPVAALPTPSTQFSRKRKFLTDVDDGVPSLRTKLNDRFLNPSSGGELGQYTLDNEGHWEKRVRGALQDLDLPRFETAPERLVPTTIMSESEGDPLSFVYDKLQVQPGRKYQVEIVENRAVYRPEHKRYRAPTWELRGRQENNIRAFLRLNRAGFTHDEATAICGKFVDALNRWPDLNAISTPKGAFLPGRASPLIQTLLSAAQHSALPDKPLRYNAPVLSVESQPIVRATIHHIDPQTLEGKTYWTYTGNHVDANVLVPDTPDTQSIRFSIAGSSVVFKPLLEDVLVVILPCRVSKHTQRRTTGI